MFDFSGVEETLTTESIHMYVSEYDIFKYYCTNFEEIDVSFCSELRNDNHPGCRVYITGESTLRYKDFGNGSNYNCWGYIMTKYGCKFNEALTIVANDFNIRTKQIDISPSLVLANDTLRARPKIIKTPSIITITPQNWGLKDHDYWNQYGISFDTLGIYDVCAFKYGRLTKGSSMFTFEYRKSNPCYAYKFTNGEETSYKLYWPLSTNPKRKWLFNGSSSNNVEGYDQLPYLGDKVVLTKSLKDCMCYFELGIPAVSLQGEGNRPSSELIEELSNRFKEIVLNYDNDAAGVIATDKIVKEYGFRYFYIEGEKDLSDYIKKNGVVKAGVLIDKLLNNE